MTPEPKLTERQWRTVRALVDSAMEVTEDRGLRRDCGRIIRKIDMGRVENLNRRITKALSR